MNREMGKNKLEDTKDKFEQIGEAGDDIASKAEQIDSGLNNINLDGLDAEDIAAKDAATEGYKADFDSAVDEQISSPTNDARETASSDVEQLNESKDRVNDARTQFENISGISDIGSNNAEQASSQMETSVSDYENIIEDNKAAMEAAEQRAQEIKNRVGGLF